MSSTGNHDKVEEIKNRLDIVDVIGRDIALKNKGGGEYTGATSSSSKSGASLKVDQKIQSFKNFATGEGGDVLDWIGYYARYKDTRGADFPEVLKIAAALAGVELEEATEEERNAAKEKADIHNIFTSAAEIYHTNITPTLYAHILQKWGITQETVDKFKIGYATTGRDLKDLDKEILKKSGLVYVNGGMSGGEVFTGRIIFPYWKNGKVVYLIGRETEETPEAEREKGMKYKKLLVHKEDREYVSHSVQNSYFYGEDSLRGSDYCIITEGVADCISMLQAGFPCISPVTVQFREKDNQKLISLANGLNRVYICNDNEANNAGIKGALSTAEALESAGIETRLIELPKPEGIDKIDIADYMKEHIPEDFNELIDSSLGLWDFKLNQQVIKGSSTSLERLRAFKVFISNDLHLMQLDEWQIFVNNEVTGKFRLKLKDVKSTIEEIGKSRRNDNKNEMSEPAEDPEAKKETDERLSGYPGEIQKSATHILETGNPFEFIIGVWNRLHIGDRNIGENLLCSIAGTQIKNTKLGMHQKPSGESGTGKSDAIKYMLKLLPSNKYIEGSLSSKALFYDDTLQKGTIVYTDDAKLEGDIVTTLRAATSDYQEETIHRTINGERKLEIFKIPPRVTFWMSMVNSIQDEQLATRFFFGDTDSSEEQDIRVNRNQTKRVTIPYSVEEDTDVLTCRCIFDIIFQNDYSVYAPFAEAIAWNDMEHRRNYDKFLDLLQAVTLFNFKNRKSAYGGIVSNLDDYDRALQIYNGTAANNATNLNGKEMSIMKVIQCSPGRTISFTEIQEKTGFKETSLRYIIDGRNGGEGLLGKVTGLYKLEKSESISFDKGNIRSTTKGTVYRYTGDIFELGSKLFGSVATIDRAKAKRLTCEFIDSNNEKDGNSHNSHTTLTLDVRDKNDNRIDNNNNKYTKLTNTEEIGGSNCSYVYDENPGEIEKSHAQNLCECSVREICEDSSKSGQKITNTDVRVDVSALTNESTDYVNKCEPNVRVDDSNCNTKDLIHLKFDLKTFKGDYDRKHGGVSNIDDFVDNFLKSGHNGYLNLFSNEDIKFEAVKICKTYPQVA